MSTLADEAARLYETRGPTTEGSRPLVELAERNWPRPFRQRRQLHLQQGEPRLVPVPESSPGHSQQPVLLRLPADPSPCSRAGWTAMAS